PEHDIEDVAGSADGRVLAWIENDEGWASLRVRDVERGVDLPAPKLPPGTISPLGSGMSLSADGSRLAIVWDGPTRPAEVFVVDTATGDALPVTESRAAGLSALDLREPELIRYESFDGRQIPAWLYRPEGDGPFPFSLLIHGGPEARERRARDEHPRLDRLRQDLPEAHPPRLGRRRSRGLAPCGRVAEGAAVRRRRSPRRVRRLVRRL